MEIKETSALPTRWRGELARGLSQWATGRRNPSKWNSSPDLPPCLAGETLSSWCWFLIGDEIHHDHTCLSSSDSETVLP